jgi:phage/plasmid primase-like uncharacterized protein
MHCHRNNCAVYAELRSRGLIEGSLVKGRHDTHGPTDTSPDREQEERRLRYAHEIFDEGVSCEGTPAALYLASRGLGDLRFQKLRRTLRFHPSVLHSGSGQRLPAMVAQVRDAAGNRMGIHRTFLTSAGHKANVVPAKMALGPIAEGAVRFGPDNPVIAIAEGIETALSVSRASHMTTWACLSSSGMRGVILPPLPIARIVIICADADPAGISAAEAAAERLEREGRRTSIIAPKTAGQDWNDVLCDFPGAAQ